MAAVLGASLSVLRSQAMVDVAADAGFLLTTLRLMNLAQMVVQGRWHVESTLLTLPHVKAEHVRALARQVCAQWARSLRATDCEPASCRK